MNKTTQCVMALVFFFGANAAYGWADKDQLSAERLAGYVEYVHGIEILREEGEEAAALRNRVLQVLEELSEEGIDPTETQQACGPQCN